ncbi:hypothetical protein QO010_000037 [Caulobacter ginsengisoli]|uniref:Sporulation protein n=1 Tax=Caulobacter ginsengisoli TaxID=400775 RepID=A0ABU0IK20_9CAUL|nr:hypothetical protein [Caulobacter ginsengisoli]MDQ0462289.1 hypothetical protein [Caulobacter ginsengisoli]
MKELFYGIGAAALVGLAGGAAMKLGPIESATRDGSMAPVAQGYAYDDTASYAPVVAPVYYDSWARPDQTLLQSAAYDAGDADVPRYDPRPAPEDRADAIRQAALLDTLSAPQPDQAPVRYPSASGDILSGLTPHGDLPGALPVQQDPRAALSAPPPPAMPDQDDSAPTGDTRPVAPHSPS